MGVIADMDQLQVVATRVPSSVGQQVSQPQRAASQVVDKYLKQDKENSGVRWGGCGSICSLSGARKKAIMFALLNGARQQARLHILQV